MAQPSQSCREDSQEKPARFRSKEMSHTQNFLTAMQDTHEAPPLTLPKIRDKARCPFPSLLLNTALEVIGEAIRQEKPQLPTVKPLGSKGPAGAMVGG